MQGDYKKSARIECGRPVFERFGGVAMWFVRDCEGGSQPADKNQGDEGEWWVGPIESVGFGGDMLLGPPARGPPAQAPLPPPRTLQSRPERTRGLPDRRCRNLNALACHCAHMGCGTVVIAHG